MTQIKVIDINEETKQEAIEQPIEEVKEDVKEEVKEEVNEVIQEVKEEHIKPKPEEPEPEQLKNNSKSERLKDKNITCPKCNKTMLLRSYRYKHELNCQGKLEERAIKPKSKPKPIIKQVEVNEQLQPEPKPVIKQQIHQQPTNPLMDITNQYAILQNQYIQQKKEKYNNLCQSMFSSKTKMKR